MPWAILFSSCNALDGYNEHLGGAALISRPAPFGGYKKMVFATRKEARQYIADNYAYFSRDDLRAEPHGWKMPRAVRVRVHVELEP